MYSCYYLKFKHNMTLMRKCNKNENIVNTNADAGVYNTLIPIPAIK